MVIENIKKREKIIKMQRERERLHEFFKQKIQQEQQLE